MKYVLEFFLEQLKYVPHEVSSQEYGYATIEIKEQIQTKEHITQEVQEDQIDPTLKL